MSLGETFIISGCGIIFIALIFACWINIVYFRKKKKIYKIIQCDEKK